MNPRLWSFGGVVALLGLVSGGCAAPAAAGLTDADRAAIRQASDQSVTAANAREFTGYAGVFSDDAVLMAPNMPAVRGRAAILAWAQTYPPFSNFRLDPTEIEGSADVAYSHGSFSITIEMPGAPPFTDRGKYLEIWRKQADGSWKLTRDIFNSDLPVPAPPPPADAK